ncbi:ABC transporter permease [Pseudoroseomonas cervicalis]|uniref:ABC transporter permease n=1 Tax=Teichococcus cervicalis TaxID=204525 RepID=UPI00277E0D7A|nr:ABC transporter permease [Pseudoroseomonas cervicalis]MDQ1079293.1 branched-chain amino acid transport system permease protein [Pseudoroseomonas cervicalis]
MQDLAVQALNGLASAASLFLVASGLTLIFGVSRIVNFAHGSLYMLGAYLGWTLLRLTPLGEWGLGGFAGAVLLAALAAGGIGALLEMSVLRRIYRAPELFQLLATFALVLVVQDLVLLLWGAEDKFGPRAPLPLRGAAEFLGLRFPRYELFLIALGPVMLGLLWLLLNRTRFGILLRAATQDREMVAALGVDQRLLFTGVFFLGAALAGLGGALQLPREAVTPHMDMAIIVEAFVVVVLGGLGSIPGAFLAALLIGELHAFGILVFPRITLVLVFLVMAVVLVLRPNGLLGRPAGPPPASEAAPPLPAPGSFLPAALRWPLLALAAAALLPGPLLLGEYPLILLADFAVFVLFAASLQLIMGPGGMASFGHAAFFGAGAYAAALAVKYGAAPMLLGLSLAPFAAGLAGLGFGWFCARLSGVYAAMLTLAFAQILWSIAFQWVEVTGGDNGILGIWPADWARGKLAFWYLALALCGGGVWLLRRAVHAPFGLALRGQRDSALRAEAIGLDAFRLRWAAFTLAAFWAGLAGAVFAYGKGSVFPSFLGIGRSVDGLLMVLLGGVHSLAGPLLGAVAFAGLQEQLARVTDLWRLLLGLIILALVIFFPRGLGGALSAGLSRLRRPPEGAA